VGLLRGAGHECRAPFWWCGDGGSRPSPRAYGQQNGRRGQREDRRCRREEPGGDVGEGAEAVGSDGQRFSGVRVRGRLETEQRQENEKPTRAWGRE